MTTREPNLIEELERYISTIIGRYKVMALMLPRGYDTEADEACRIVEAANKGVLITEKESVFGKS